MIIRNFGSNNPNGRLVRTLEEALREVFEELDIDITEDHDIDDFVDKVKAYLQYDGERGEWRSERVLHSIGTRLDNIEEDVDMLCHFLFQKDFETVYRESLEHDGNGQQTSNGIREVCA